MQWGLHSFLCLFFVCSVLHLSTEPCNELYRGPRWVKLNVTELSASIVFIVSSDLSSTFKWSLCMSAWSVISLQSLGVVLWTELVSELCAVKLYGLLWAELLLLRSLYVCLFSVTISGNIHFELSLLVSYCLWACSLLCLSPHILEPSLSWAYYSVNLVVSIAIHRPCIVTGTLYIVQLSQAACTIVIGIRQAGAAWHSTSPRNSTLHSAHVDVHWTWRNH